MLNRIQYKIGLISAICLLVAVAACIVISVLNNKETEHQIESLIEKELKQKSQLQLQAIAELGKQ